MTAAAAAVAGETHSRWRPYRAVISARFRMLLSYRAAAIGGMFTQTVFGLVLIMVYEAFYRSPASAAPPMQFSQVASYVWLGQALLVMMPWNVDSDVRAMVRSGAVAYELCRPIDLYNLWFARAIAYRTAPTSLRAVPIVVIAAIGLPLVGLDEWRLAPPPSFAAAGGFAVALVCALALACALSMLTNISLLWTVGGEGIVLIMATVVSVLSGLLIPLPMLPGWLQPVVRWLPFAGIFDLPFRIYTGHIPVSGLALVLARQVGWTVALVMLGRWLLGRGMRRLVVQGG
jgi:ABC-2 type transport system permease protein